MMQGRMPELTPTNKPMIEAGTPETDTGFLPRGLRKGKNAEADEIIYGRERD